MMTYHNHIGWYSDDNSGTDSKDYEFEHFSRLTLVLLKYSNIMNIISIFYIYSYIYYRHAIKLIQMINMLIIILLTAAFSLISMILNFIYIIIVKSMKSHCFTSLQDVFTLLAYHYVKAIIIIKTFIKPKVYKIKLCYVCYVKVINYLTTFDNFISAMIFFINFIDMNDRCTLYNGHPSLEIVLLVFPTNYVVVVFNLYVSVILMKSYYYYCYHQTKEMFFNRKRTLDGLNIVSGYMTTLLYIIYMYITTEVILYMVWMTFHLLHLQMYFIMNHESESYCTVLATCILTMLTSCATMIIMPKGLISSTVHRDYNVMAHFRIPMSGIFVDYILARDMSITRKKDCTERNKFHLIVYKYKSRFETCPTLYYLILRSRFRPR